MRHLSIIVVFAFALSTSPLLAQEADQHAGHHPQATAPAPAPAPDATPSPEASDKGCAMMKKMEDGKMGSADRDMKTMQDKMKMCMAGPSKDSGGTADQHKH